MERPNTVSGLIAKRREIKAQIRRLIVSVRHIDATIALFDPDAPTRKRRVPHGLRHRFILAYLRDATGPVTAAEASNAWIKQQGLKLDANGRNEIRRRVRNMFGKLKAAGALQDFDMIGGRKGWLLALKPPSAASSPSIDAIQGDQEPRPQSS